jgi:DNA-directed RNA polymerase specialized sigma24 family protein
VAGDVDPPAAGGQLGPLDELQERAERQDRERVNLDRLYDESIPGIRPELEQSIAPEDEKTARKVWDALSEEDRRLLEASYGMSYRRAAEALGLPPSTFQYRLNRARARARELLEDS